MLSRVYPIALLAVFAVFCGPPSVRAQEAALTHGGFENGGFEQTAPGSALAAGWTAYGAGYVRDTQIHHSGAVSLRCDAPDTTGTFGALYTLTLNQTVAAPIFFSGWSKARNVDGVTDNDYSLYVDLNYTDGSSLWGQTAPFGTGTHDWQRRKLTIFPSKPLRSVNVYALFRTHNGTVWFDDFEAREAATSTLFDGQALAPPTLPAGTTHGWFVRDVAANSPLRPLPAGQTVLGLRLNPLKPSRDGQIETGTLRNLTPRNRALTVYYVERFSAPRPMWENDIRNAVPATGGGEYENLTPVNVGATGQLSLYPFGCVTGQGAGRMVGLPPALNPRVTRVGYHSRSRLLFLACDLALTAHGSPAGHDTAAHDSAVIGAVHAPVDPAWGFRDAAARWYALFPEGYVRRAKAEGIWMPFTDPAKVKNPRDFHFAYHEGDNSVASDKTLGILSFRYVEPMTYWMPMPKGAPRTYAEALAQVRRQATGTDEIARRQSQAVLTSGTRDESGRLNVSFRNAPWCDGAVWVLNPSPHLPVPAGQWSKARLNTFGGPRPDETNPPDGEYLDSLEAWADVLNYDPTALQHAPFPLTFAADTLRPALPTWFSMYGATTALSADLHRRRKLLMANSTPWRFSAFAPLLDVLGTEANTFTDAGEWQPEPDAIQNLRRTASYHKSYLLLLNTDFTKTDTAKMETYFQRCLFYGFYPSMFSVNASDKPYWEDPNLPDRDRPLFQKYIPVIQMLSAAGWEPVTGARSDKPDVWLERFGARYLSVLNSGTGPATVTVTIDPAHFVPKSGQVWDVLSGQVLGTERQAGMLTVTLTLQPSETRVLSVGPNNGHE